MANSITNVQALTALVEFAQANGYADADVLAKVRKHIAVLSKPKAKSDAPSKTQVMNQTLSDRLYEFLAGCESPVTAGQVVDGLGSAFVTTPQKATILLGMLVSQGRAERTVSKGRALWTAVR